LGYCAAVLGFVEETFSRVEVAFDRLDYVKPVVYYMIINKKAILI